MTLFAISREPNAEWAPLRASIGGNAKMGYYLVFRGDPAEVLAMLEAVTEEARRALPDKDYADKRGRPQG